MEKEEIEAVISGRVQLVMFRDFTARTARSLSLAGFVRNNRDGTVTAVAQGERGKLEKLLACLKKGSLLSRVDSISVLWKNPEKEYSDFTIMF